MDSDPSQIPVLPSVFEHGLSRFAQSLEDQRAVKIVAIGSSTTAGEGGIVAYPYRLEALLRDKYRNRMIDVLNRGIGGQEAPVELARFDRDVFAEEPSLVIWQVGTNAVWQRPDQKPPPPSFDETADAIREGLARLHAYGRADVILMDLQYVPGVLTPAKIDKAIAMAEAIAEIAREAKVNVFRRFALMKAWHQVEGVSFDRMVDPEDPDRLHDSDWTTQRLAWMLKEAIVDSVTGVRASAVV